jgi:predicted type IV restriction endonuclease
MKRNQIATLVEKFNHNLEEYKNPKYNEAQVRAEFVNPFFEALGWDVYVRRQSLSEF